MRRLIITTVALITACGGNEFTNVESGYSSYVGEQYQGQAGTGGASLPVGEAGSETGISGFGNGQGGMGQGTTGQGQSGANALAGGPSMGEGGEGGSFGPGDVGPRTCLANHQSLECARVCDSQPACQGILDCFVSMNSTLTSDCPGFSDTGYSLALEAERMCCHG